MSEHPQDEQSRPGDGETIGASSPGHDESLERDPQEWVSGDDPMTEAQRSYLDTLAKRAGEELPADLTKAQASEHIDRLRSSEQGGGEGSPAS